MEYDQVRLPGMKRPLIFGISLDRLTERQIVNGFLHCVEGDDPDRTETLYAAVRHYPVENYERALPMFRSLSRSAVAGARMAVADSLVVIAEVSIDRTGWIDWDIKEMWGRLLVDPEPRVSNVAQAELVGAADESSLPGPVVADVLRHFFMNYPRPAAWDEVP